MTIKLKALRALRLDGREVAAGSIVTLPAEQAVEVLDAGRTELLDPADAQIIVAARRTARARLAASLPAVREFMPASGPWIGRP